MSILEKIADLFSSDRVQDSFEENNSELNCRYSLNEFHTPTKSEVQSVYADIFKQDKLTITVEFDSSEPSYLAENNIEFFLTDLKHKIAIHDEDDAFPDLKIKIEKARSDNQSSVYDIDKLVEFWSRDGLVSCLSRIQELKRDVSILRVWGISNPVKTNLFYFLPAEVSVEFQDTYDREDILDKRDKTCHFANSTDFYLVPQDFQITSENAPITLIELFSKLKLITSLTYLCDFTRYEGEVINFRLNGYRLLNKEVSKLEDVNPKSSNEYYQIYCWVYGDGEVIDKVGLARNLISLHLCEDDLMIIHEGTLQSITSGYQIYLKENVKQYIEIKNKVSESIQSSSDKASDIAKAVGSYYRNSIWTMYSFFISLFLLRTFIRESPKLITDEIMALFIAFTIITIVAMHHALNELEQDKIRLIGGYQLLKNRYKDLLLSEDLQKILDYDRQHNSDIDYIDSRKSQYRKLWATSISVMFVVMAILWLNGS